MSSFKYKVIQLILNLAYARQNQSLPIFNLIKLYGGGSGFKSHRFQKGSIIYESRHISIDT